MIQKIQTLQKRLIGKTEEVVEKEMLIQEQEKKIEELQGKLSKTPKQDVMQKLSFYKQNLREKTKQLMVVSVLNEVDM